jgi:hypothetical protein
MTRGGVVLFLSDGALTWCRCQYSFEILLKIMVSLLVGVVETVRAEGLGGWKGAQIILAQGETHAI